MGLSNLSSGFRPGVCTSTTRPTAPYEGQMIYETDTDYLLIYDGSSWKYLTQGQATVPGSWTTFTPTFKFGTTNAATSSTYGFYTRLNKLVIIQAGFISSGSQSSGNLSFTFPDSLSHNEGRSFQRLGAWYIYDASPNTQYLGTPYINNTDGTSVLGFGPSSGNAISNTSPFTWAVNDECDIWLNLRLD